MGRGSPSVTQRLVQARGAQVWRAGALHSVCLQDGKEDAQLSAGRARLVSPGRVQGPAPLGQDGFKQPEQADLLGQPWATWCRPLRMDAPSPAGLTASSFIHPRSAASRALVGPGLGASCRRVAPSLQVWGPWRAGPRPGHPGSCTHKRGDGGSGWEAVCPALRPPAPGTQLSGLCLGGLDLGHLAWLYPRAVGGDRRATDRPELGLAQSGYRAAVAGRLGRARCVTTHALHRIPCLPGGCGYGGHSDRGLIRTCPVAGLSLVCGPVPWRPVRRGWAVETARFFTCC